MPPRRVCVLLAAHCATAWAGPSAVGKPLIESASSRCAAIEFELDDDAAADGREKAYIFAKRPRDNDFMLWGSALPFRKVEHPPVGETVDSGRTMYRVLMRELPPGQKFQVKVGLRNDVHSEASEPSDFASTRDEGLEPRQPHNVMIHRTDPRSNIVKHDGSVCVDVHWSHPTPQLDFHPDDAYFRISHQYIGEKSEQVCEDALGDVTRSCGTTIDLVSSELPSFYQTICGLRPDRHVAFTVEVFDCDGHAKVETIHVVSPPSAPSVVATLVTAPGAQEAIAGFRPTAALDWIPQHDDLIEGHAVYVGLRDIASVKLLCWVPNGHISYAAGHLDIPIAHRNHTFAEDSALLRAYQLAFHVHQEQEIWVGTRVKGHLESPAYVYSLGEWLVLEEALKCLTSFQSEHPSYVSSPVNLLWTQTEAMSLYD